ncbi:tRNA (adenosine(37)-N6)-dimethylallyltransferase MiaA [Silvanigrella aquatica]|uniref:tRNA dimethylallyltransferase n=1 Tax=Silvanigrella aquatica TaxID=1915309 RepID=A0A1L4D045_9BACT|nr:tRNA (adenosine(37)-N6)-dimethylallyltransferase MiaA [Silvanigrella aquatica]APJ03576.1 tRNA (adenosine(37)-N6)-dimethylallyltransferase MiaA [Silvanigrella aquatica]
MVSKDLNTNTNFFAIVVIGPTASGKTALAHSLSDQLKKQGIQTELVNLDAFQIFQEVTAGTAKPQREEIEKYQYHCLDIIPPQGNLDANTFAQMLTKDCQDIALRGNIPLCVGGSGLYLRAFLHGLDDLPPRDEKFREEIRNMGAEKGWEHCHEILKKIDPIRAAELHPNDKTRIERALEIFHILGKPMSSLRSKTTSIGAQSTRFPCYVVHMEPDDQFLKERIKERVPLLFNQGWLLEVQNLLLKYGENLKNFHSMKAIGYNEILTFLLESEKKKSIQNNEMENLFEKISTLTWQYAKKQSTWNAKEKKDFSVHEYTHAEFELLLKNVLSQISLQTKQK